MYGHSSRKEIELIALIIIIKVLCPRLLNKTKIYKQQKRWECHRDYPQNDCQFTYFRIGIKQVLMRVLGLVCFPYLYILEIKNSDEQPLARAAQVWSNRVLNPSSTSREHQPTTGVTEYRWSLTKLSKIDKHRTEILTPLLFPTRIFCNRLSGNDHQAFVWECKTRRSSGCEILDSGCVPSLESEIHETLIQIFVLLL